MPRPAPILNDNHAVDSSAPRQDASVVALREEEKRRASEVRRRRVDAAIAVAVDQNRDLLVELAKR
jgi:hypothetical protein